MTSSIRLTIVIPCLNEAKTIARCVSKAQGWIKSSQFQAEVLVSDNGSTDGSGEIAAGLGARVIFVKQRGYGAALMAASRQALGEWIIMADADDSYDLGNLDLFVQQLSKGYDLVIGNRMKGGIEPGAMPWLNRYIGNPVLSAIGKFLFRAPVGDFHCGMRAYTKAAFKKMDLRTTGMEFASEMVIKASLFNLQITEVPTRLFKDGRQGPSHLQPWRDGWRHLRFMLLFAPQWLFIIPGAVILFLSLPVYLVLMQGPLQVGGLRFDIHTLFFSGMGALIGWMAISFGVIIHLLAIREGLMPDHPSFVWLKESPVLEWGGLVGILLVLTGLMPACMALLTWGHAGFGVLAYGALLREVSLSTVLILFGSQVLMTSLIIGFLALPEKNTVL